MGHQRLAGRASPPGPESVVSPETDDAGRPDPGLDGSMMEIGPSSTRSAPSGMGSKRGESITAPTEKLSDEAQFGGQVRRASVAGHPVARGISARRRSRGAAFPGAGLAHTVMDGVRWRMTRS
jgi:hypothetical protein